MKGFSTLYDWELGWRKNKPETSGFSSWGQMFLQGRGGGEGAKTKQAEHSKRFSLVLSQFWNLTCLASIEHREINETVPRRNFA